jgi:hypothetical protein
MSPESDFTEAVKKLHQLTVYGRWSVVGLCWLTLGARGIWGLRNDIPLWFDYFTWSALRYALAYHPVSTLCLAICIAMTCSVLVWQSRNVLIGLPARERYRLEQKVQKIQTAGKSHPLWKWINR